MRRPIIRWHNDRRAETRRLDDGELYVRTRLVFAIDVASSMPSGPPPITSSLRMCLADCIWKRRDADCCIRPKDGWAEAPRGTRRRKMNLRVGIGDESPYLRSKFRAAGCNHEARCAIDRSRPMPAAHESQYIVSDQFPYTGRRTVDHFCRKHRINRQGLPHRRSHSIDARLVGTRSPLAGK